MQRFLVGLLVTAVALTLAAPGQALAQTGQLASPAPATAGLRSAVSDSAVIAGEGVPADVVADARARTAMLGGPATRPVSADATGGFDAQQSPVSPQGVSVSGLSTGTISGTVTMGPWLRNYWLTGHPGDAPFVTLYSDGGNYVTRLTLDSSMSFSFTNVAPGTYQVSVAPQTNIGASIETFWSDAFTSETADEMVLSAGETISGLEIAVNDPGQVQVNVIPASGATTVCFTAMGTDTQWVSTTCDPVVAGASATGQLVVSETPTGKYIVAAWQYFGSTPTDYTFWNNTSADKRIRQNAGSLKAWPVAESGGMWWNPNPYLGAIDLRSLAALGTGDVSYAAAVTPNRLLSGEQSPGSLWIAPWTTGPIPSGYIDLHDSSGFVTTVKLTSVGSGAFTWVPPFTGSALSLYYRGNSVYSDADLPVSVSYVPRLFSADPGYVDAATGGDIALNGYGFQSPPTVTAGAVPLTVAASGDVYATATVPPLTPGEHSLILHTANGSDNRFPPSIFALDESETVVLDTPERLFDMRGATPRTAYCTPIAGGDTVPLGATAAIINVTTANAQGPGNVVVYPDADGTLGTPPPHSSSVNFETGRDVANSVVVALPSNGWICAYVHGTTLGRLIFDVSGFIVPGSGITTQTSQRLLDTRYAGQITGPVAGGSTHTIQVTGNAGVPAGSTAILANVTVTSVKAPGHLKVWAADLTEPRSSVINYVPGQDKANAQIIGLSPDGTLSFKSVSSDTTQIIIDVVGYVAGSSDYYSVTPTRLIDTRPGGSHVGTIPGALNTSYIYSFGFDDTTLVPTNADAVVLNVTVASVPTIGHLTVYPDTNGDGTTAPPYASNINYIPGRDIPNLVIVKLPPNRRINLTNQMSPSTASTNVAIDIVGYIAALPPAS